MNPSAPRGFAMPNFRTSRLLGIFNVVFASELLLCGVCMGGYVVTLPLWARVFSQFQARAEQQGDQARKAALDGLAQQEKAATTPEARAEFAARRRDIENRPRMNMAGVMDLSKMGLDDPKLIRWSWFEVLSGLFLNTLMLTSGIGLLSWRPWARSLGVWTAVLKILRLGLAYGYYIVEIVPSFSERMGKAVGEMMVVQQGAIGRIGPGATPPTDVFVKIYTVTYSAMGLGFAVLAMIYPLILLWFLTRPGVKLACSGTLKLPREPNQPC
ncbi:MAG: hypothetical protein NVSMB9_10820 [Isosphaeraceae bacterium]